MKLQACLEDLQRIAKLRPEYPDAWYDIGTVLVRLGRDADALAALDRALEIHPAYLDAGVSRCFQLSAMGRVPEGFRNFRRLHVRSPDDFDVVFALGVFCMRNGWKDTGLEQLRRAERMRPNLPYVLLHVAAALSELGDGEAAQERMVRARGIVRSLAINSFFEGAAADAWDMEFYRQWQDPRAVKIHALLANFSTAHGDPEGAERELHQAVWRLPGHSLLMPHLARLLLARGKKTEAVRCLTAATRMDMNCHQAHFELSFLHAEHKDYEQAVAALRKAVFLRPLSPDYHFHLGTLLKDTGRLDEAVEQFKRLLAINPSDPHGCVHLANTYLEKDACDEALAVLAASARTDWPEALVLSARAYLKSGQKLKARALLEKALAVDHANSEAQALLSAVT